MVALVSCELRLVVELTIDDNIDFVAQLVGLSITSDLEPARMRVDVGLVSGGEQDNVTDHTTPGNVTLFVGLRRHRATIRHG